MPNWHETQEYPRSLLAQEGQDSCWLGPLKHLVPIRPHRGQVSLWDESLRF